MKLLFCLLIILAVTLAACGSGSSNGSAHMPHCPTGDSPISGSTESAVMWSACRLADSEELSIQFNSLNYPTRTDTAATAHLIGTEFNCSVCPREIEAEYELFRNSQGGWSVKDGPSEFSETPASIEQREMLAQNQARELLKAVAGAVSAKDPNALYEVFPPDFRERCSIDAFAQATSAFFSQSDLAGKAVTLNEADFDIYFPDGSTVAELSYTFLVDGHETDTLYDDLTFEEGRWYITSAIQC